MTETESAKPEPVKSELIKLRSYRPLPLILAFIFGSFVLLFMGFMGGREFEKVRIRHLDNWRTNYQTNFMMRGRPMMQPPINAHGILGKILTIDTGKISVQGRDGTEESVLVNSNTAIRSNGAIMKQSDLKVGQEIAVFGQPNNQGQVSADLIRIFTQDENPLP